MVELLPWTPFIYLSVDIIYESLDTVFREIVMEGINVFKHSNINN